MVADVIDVVTRVSGLEGKAAVARHVQVLINVVFSKGTADIACADHDTHC